MEVSLCPVDASNEYKPMLPTTMQPPQSSICSAQAAVKASVTRPAASQHVPSGCNSLAEHWQLTRAMEPSA